MVLQKIDKPTFQTSDNRIHNSVTLAADHEAKLIFERCLDDEIRDQSMVLSRLGPKWKLILSELLALHETAFPKPEPTGPLFPLGADQRDDTGSYGGR